MRVRVIAAVLTTACLAAGGLVYWGSGQQIRLDPVTLPGDGVSQSSDELPVQVAEGDLLYRSWDGSSHVEVAAAEDATLSTAALVRFDGGDLMLTQDALSIDPAGTATEVPARELWEVQGDQSYTAASGEIGSHDVVRLAQRRYYFAPEAHVLVDGVEVGTTEQTQIAIDRTGAATLTGADNVRQRYLGHVQLVVDAGYILDVSAEMYFVDGQSIDLTAFGGSDNEMLVLADDATTAPTEEPTSEVLAADPDAEAETAGSAAANSSDAANSTGTGAASTGQGAGDQSVPGATTPGATAPGTGSGTGPDQETLDRYQELIDEINRINEERQQTATPTATLTQVSAGASEVSATLTVSDPSAALVGPVTVTVTDSSGTVVDTATAPAGISAIQLGPLTPGETYTLSGSFTYDFGNGTGQQSGSAGSALTFTTLNVNAIYTVSDVKSTSARVRVSLDTPVRSISSATLQVVRTGGFLGIGDGQVQQVTLSAADLAAGGASVLISGLDPETTYYVQATVQLASGGQTLTMGRSPQLVTSAATTMSASAEISTLGTVAVDYSWTSEEYRLTDVEVQLSRPGLFGRSVAATVVAEGPGSIELIPAVEGDVTGTVTVVATDADGVERRFTESLPTLTWSESWALGLTEDESAGAQSLVVTGPADAAEVTVRFERSARTDGSTWTVLGSSPLTVAASGGTEAVWAIPAESVPFTAGSTFRAVVERDGQDLLTIPLSTEDGASEGTQS